MNYSSKPLEIEDVKIENELYYDIQDCIDESFSNLCFAFDENSENFIPEEQNFLELTSNKNEQEVKHDDYQDQGQR